MSAESQFVDTNVLVYLFDNDSREKQYQARQLLEKEAENIVLSTQVLGEFYVTVTRKLATPLKPRLARDAVDDLCALRVRALRAELVQAAVRRSDASQLSYWDALIVETAIDAGATILLTEDLQHGQEFNGLRVVDPFRGQA
jgi:predicted nucleic acid-binding protein